MVKIVKKIIELKREKGNYSEMSRDVIDVLLKSVSDQEQELVDDLIAGNMIDMMIPGEDSVPLLITLAIKYLSDSPAALKQLTVNFRLLILFFVF